MNIELDYIEFKTAVADRKLLMQYVEKSASYLLYAVENGVIFSCPITKVSDEATDFEAHFKTTANAPLEVKAGAGRPPRVAPSPQPNDTTEMWEGFHLDIPALDAYGIFDLEFSTLVYLRGGSIYSPDMIDGDKISADVVLKAMPSYVIFHDQLKNIRVLPNMKIDFLSAECKELPATVMLRVVYTKKEGDINPRSVSAIADYYKPNT